MSSPQFDRAYRLTAAYQELLKKNDDKKKLETIKERFHKIFGASHGKDHGVGSDSGGAVSELDDMRKRTFTLCETGELTKEKMADLFVGLSIADAILKNWKPEIGSTNADGHCIVNEVVEYKKNILDDTEISLNIFPTSVDDVRDLLEKINDGLQKVAKEMRQGSLQRIEKVSMISWLFGPRFEKITKKIFRETLGIPNLSFTISMSL